jgi:hypothetical protein
MDEKKYDIPDAEEQSGLMTVLTAFCILPIMMFISAVILAVGYVAYKVIEVAFNELVMGNWLAPSVGAIIVITSAYVFKRSTGLNDTQKNNNR